jgi:hypothetical protein
MSAARRIHAFVAQLSTDDRGSIDVASYLLMVTLLGIGVVVGLSSVRDGIVQGLGDVAMALENVNQSYSFTVGTVTSEYVDSVPGNNVPGTPPACINLTVAASPVE